ncbi:Aquaporin-4 [Rhizophlyctis rosea]|nr:Aquaporin-4 [Rhizophlyctis rosea]
MIYVADTASSVLLAALAQGFTITALVAICGKISGGHINPAVTLCLVIVRNFAPVTGILYIIAQIFGGILGAAIWLGTAGDHAVTLGATVKTFPSPGQAFLLEFVITSMLMFTVLGTALHSDADFKPLAPIPIGFSITAGVLIAGLVTGGSMNPARSFGPAIVSNTWTLHWIYWIAPFSSATIVGISYKLLFLSAPLTVDEAEHLGLNNYAVTDEMGAGCGASGRGVRFDGTSKITTAEAIDMRAADMEEIRIH